MTIDKEVKNVLLGKMLPTDDGRLSSIPKDEFRLPIGVSDGAGAVRFFGVSKRCRKLETAQPKLAVMQDMLRAMQNVGRQLVLQGQPDVRACFIRYVATRPAVITLEYREDIPVITAWAGRGISGWISQSRALKAFAKVLPEGYSLSKEKFPKPKKEKKKKKEKEKKEEAPLQEQVQETQFQEPVTQGPNVWETENPEQTESPIDQIKVQEEIQDEYGY